MAGGQAIARKAREAIEAGRRTQLSSHIAPDKIHAVDVAAAAQRGDLVAQQIITDAGTYLGIAVASLVNFFNPSMVVIGGGVSQLGDLLLEPIRKTVMERSLTFRGESCSNHICGAWTDEPRVWEQWFRQSICLWIAW